MKVVVVHNDAKPIERDWASQYAGLDSAVQAQFATTADWPLRARRVFTIPALTWGDIVLLGWSNGGSTVLYSVEPKHAPEGQQDFKKAIAFYPGCRVPLETAKWSTRIPLLILIGEADDWTAAAPCHDLATSAQAAGKAVEIIGAVLIRGAVS
jgi:dienelactone hydrolase